jgi:hypothetical protein
VFRGKGGGETARVVLLYAGPKVGTKDDLDLRMWKGYKGYSIRVLLGHKTDRPLPYRP